MLFDYDLDMTRIISVTFLLHYNLHLLQKVEYNKIIKNHSGLS